MFSFYSNNFLCSFNMWLIKKKKKKEAPSPQKRRVIFEICRMIWGLSWRLVVFFFRKSVVIRRHRRSWKHHPNLPVPVKVCFRGINKLPRSLCIGRRKRELRNANNLARHCAGNSVWQWPWRQNQTPLDLRFHGTCFEAVKNERKIWKLRLLEPNWK